VASLVIHRFNPGGCGYVDKNVIKLRPTTLALDRAITYV